MREQYPDLAEALKANSKLDEFKAALEHVISSYAKVLLNFFKKSFQSVIELDVHCSGKQLLNDLFKLW